MMMSLLSDRSPLSSRPRKRLSEHGGSEASSDFGPNFKCQKVDSIRKVSRNYGTLTHQACEKCPEGSTRVKTVEKNLKVASQSNILRIKASVKSVPSELKIEATKPLLSHGEVDGVTDRRIHLKNVKRGICRKSKKVEKVNSARKVEGKNLEDIDDKGKGKTGKTTVGGTDRKYEFMGANGSQYLMLKHDRTKASEQNFAIAYPKNELLSPGGSSLRIPKRDGTNALEQNSAKADPKNEPMGPCRPKICIAKRNGTNASEHNFTKEDKKYELMGSRRSKYLILKQDRTSDSEQTLPNEEESPIVGVDSWKHSGADGGKNSDTLVDKQPNDLSIYKFDSYRSVVSRNKVWVTLNLYKQLLEKRLTEEQKAKSKTKEKLSSYTYVETAMELKEQGKWINMNKRFLGEVPGVEVGDQFRFRAELVIIGLHRQFAAGIDFMEKDGKKIAISIVASGRYVNETKFSGVLVYSGEGGNPALSDKEPKDQTLVRGNLALKNSMDAGNPVRVIRGFRAWKASQAGKKREKEATFTYDGLYIVSKYWQEKGKYGKVVFKFELNKMQGQPKLSTDIMRFTTKPEAIPDCKSVDDISEGKEKIPIRVVNDIDDEKPPFFNYITYVAYPPVVKSMPVQASPFCKVFGESDMTSSGCRCVNGCSDKVQCSCVVKNGGQVPYNDNGAIVRSKPIVYECGPSCKCPPSCKNRVSQHGLRFHFEVFKTEKRGWGVRSRDSIPSGSFICEYVGELLNDKQAEERTGYDEYLFDLGNEEDGFAIDAAIFGNIGRFVNHSCSPNLYAQNVLFDHENKKMPHVMLFATENIPPLQELNFDYNYKIGQVHDEYGNVKKKNCYCGAHDCTGRLY